jgi:hypothetical protein
MPIKTQAPQRQHRNLCGKPQNPQFTSPCLPVCQIRRDENNGMAFAVHTDEPIPGLPVPPDIEPTMISKIERQTNRDTPTTTYQLRVPHIWRTRSKPAAQLRSEKCYLFKKSSRPERLSIRTAVFAMRLRGILHINVHMD